MGRRGEEIRDPWCRRPEGAEVDGSGGDASRRWTWPGHGLDLDWVWSDEHKVWVPERAQRADEDDELIGKMDLAENMERNYGLACRKLQGMEKQREYLFGVIKSLRGEVKKWQESTWFWKKRYEQAERLPRRCLKRRLPRPSFRNHFHLHRLLQCRWWRGLRRGR